MIDLLKKYVHIFHLDIMNTSIGQIEVEGSLNFFFILSPKRGFFFSAMRHILYSIPARNTSDL